MCATQGFKVAEDSGFTFNLVRLIDFWCDWNRAVATAQ